MELAVHRKEEERQEEEEVTEELKRFTMQQMARGFSSFEEALSVLGAQEPKVELYTKVEAMLPSARFRMQSSATVSSMMRKKELLSRHHWVIFSRE